MKNLIMSLALLTSSFSAMAADMSKGANNFYKSDKVTAQKVTFKNQYNMTVAGNLFIPQKSKSERKKSRDRCRASDGCSEGTECESVCPKIG